MFKKNIGPILSVSVVILLVASFYFIGGSSSDTDKPPQMSLPTISLLQGNTSTCNIPGYEYEETEDIGSAVARNTLQRGAHIYHNATDRTFSEIYDSIDGVAGNKVAIVHYNAEEKEFFTYPLLGEDGVAVANTYEYTVPANEGFILISCFTSGIDAFSETELGGGIAESLRENSGWVMTIANSDTLSYLQTENTWVRTVWLQQEAGPNFEDGFLENGSESVLGFETEYKVIWVKVRQQEGWADEIENHQDRESICGDGTCQSGESLTCATDCSSNGVTKNGARAENVDLFGALGTKDECTPKTIDDGIDREHAPPITEIQAKYYNDSVEFKWDAYSTSVVKNARIYHGIDNELTKEVVQRDPTLSVPGTIQTNTITNSSVELSSRPGIHYIAIVTEEWDGNFSQIDFKAFDFSDGEDTDFINPDRDYSGTSKCKHAVRNLRAVYYPYINSKTSLTWEGYDRNDVAELTFLHAKGDDDFKRLDMEELTTESAIAKFLKGGPHKIRIKSFDYYGVLSGMSEVEFMNGENDPVPEGPAPEAPPEFSFDWVKIGNEYEYNGDKYGNNFIQLVFDKSPDDKGDGVIDYELQYNVKYFFSEPSYSYTSQGTMDEARESDLSIIFGSANYERPIYVMSDNALIETTTSTFNPTLLQDPDSSDTKNILITNLASGIWGDRDERIDKEAYQITFWFSLKAVNTETGAKSGFTDFVDREFNVYPTADSPAAWQRY